MSSADNDPKTPRELIEGDLSRVVLPHLDRLRPLAGRHVVLTGGSGTLGLWLLEILALLNRVHDWEIRATILSRRANGIPERLPHLNDPHFTFQSIDVRHLAELPADADHILHAAALTDRRQIASIPVQVIETNTLGTDRVLQAAVRTESLRSFVHLSSGLILGKAAPGENLGEEHTGRLPAPFGGDVYIESKRGAEALAYAQASESKLPVVVLRPFTMLGPYQPLDLPWAVTDFMREALAGGPIRMLSDGSPVRSFLYLADFAFWVLIAALHAPARSVYHVGSDEAIDMLSLAKLVAAEFQPAPAILTGLGRIPTQAHRLVPDIRRAARDLQLRPTVPLTEALHRTVLWHKLHSRKPR
jgi:dTDP-glucose 4,6-dehydratase